MRPIWWKIIHRILPATWPGCPATACPARQEIASVVETLKLIISQQAARAPYDWFSQWRTRYPHRRIQPTQQITLAAWRDADLPLRWRAKRWKPTRQTSGAGSTVDPAATRQRDVTSRCLWYWRTATTGSSFDVTEPAGAEKVFWLKLRPCSPGRQRHVCDHRDAGVTTRTRGADWLPTDTPDRDKWSGDGAGLKSHHRR